MNPISKIISSVIGTDKFWDLFKGKERRALEFQQALAEQLHEANNKQIELNKIEASHKSIFVAGWRPFIGWVCGSALAYQFIIRDLICYIMRVIGSTAELPPQIDITQLITILTTMLGMYGLRTFEKVKGKA